MWICDYTREKAMEMEIGSTNSIIIANVYFSDFYAS
jgi:hypothetical protein